MVIFDIATAPIDFMVTGIILAGAVVVGVGSRLVDLGWERQALVAFSALALVFAVGNVALTILERNTLLEQYRSGDTQVVEGRVSNFSRDTRTGRGPQSFDVGEHHFEMWGLRETAAFNQTVSQGGPNLSSRCVRVVFNQDREILQLALLDNPC